MDNKIGIITEVVVLIFNILIYMQLTVPKKDNFLTRFLMYVGSAIILGIFFVATYTGALPEVLASFVCVTLPTFILFFILSKYKDFRFFVTFCFLDTVTLIITFFARTIDITYGPIGGVIGGIAVCILMLLIYIKGKPYFKRYRELMSNVNDGWIIMALSTFLIYLLLIFAAAYPKPLIERTEYLLVYGFISVTILSFYAVFILSLLQRKKLADLNEQLIKEQKWHRIAYNDALTGLKNRMAYIEIINNLERMAQKDDNIYVVMIDINNFKQINDTLGHHMGDITLKNAATLFKKIFCEEDYLIFRIGGDEFAIIALQVSQETLEEKIKKLHNCNLGSDICCSFSIGYSAANFDQNNAIENAFIRADKAMYAEKMKAKFEN